jgi:uncharacterized protein
MIVTKGWVFDHTQPFRCRRKSMQQEVVLDILKKHRQELETYGVKSIALFGSTARGDAQLDSDVDILVEFEGAIGLLRFLKLQHRLEELLGKRVDLVTQAALKRQFRDRILKEVIYAG